MRLQDKVAVITGAGGGMGRTAAQMFATEGARVVVAEFSEAAGQETVRLVEEAGGQATFVKTDVSKEADAKGMIEHAVATYGRVDVLYNNAGVMPEADHSVIDTSVEAWDQVMAVNVRGTFLGCKYAIPVMLEQGSGSVINISSFVAILGCSNPAGRLHRLEGRRPGADQVAGRAVRSAGRAQQRDLPGSRRDAAAHGLAGQGRGGQAHPPGAQPHRPLRQARGDRLHGDVPGLGRIALDERGLDGRRRWHHRQLLLTDRPRVP